MCCRHRSNGNFTALFSHEQKTHAVLHGYKLVVGLKIIQLWKWPKCASVASPVRKSAIGVLSLIDSSVITSGCPVATDIKGIWPEGCHENRNKCCWSWNTTVALDGTVQVYVVTEETHSTCGSFRNFLQAQRYTSVPSFSHYEQAPMYSSHFSLFPSHCTCHSMACLPKLLQSFPAWCRLASITYLMFKEACFLSRYQQNMV